MEFASGAWHKSTRSGAAGHCVEARWKKSSFSGAHEGANCVETRLGDNETIEVRDTKANGGGATLSFTRPEWQAFIDGVKDGEFNLD